MILSSVHQDGLAKNVAESVHPRLGGSARVVGVRGRPSPRSGSDDDENRAPSWYPQVPLITTIAEPTGVGSITGRRSKRAYPLIPLTTRHLCSSSPSQDLPDEQCRCCRVWPLSSAWGPRRRPRWCRFRLVDFEHTSVCLRLGGSCAASTSLLWPTGHEPRRYHILRHATLRARRLEKRVPCRLPFPRIERQAISKVCVLPTPPHVVGKRHGCESRA